ncbi:hypothetical protein Tco_0480834 [Tanacetum coccineum]
MDQDSAHIVAASKVPMLKPGEYEIWRMRIEQYIQRILCTWESHRECWQLAINKFGRSYDRDAYYIWMLRSCWKLLKRDLLVSQLELLDEKLSQEDVNQKLLRSLSPAWNTHVVMWRNKADLDTMSMDDLYNNLKVYEPEVKGMSSSSSSTQNMAFGVQSSKKSRQQEQQNKSQEGLPRRTSTSTALVSCDGLGWIFPPPYTGNFMPPTPDLSFTGLDEFVNEPVVENCKAMSSEEEPKGNPQMDLQDQRVIDN